jgi:hypothetical protein
MNHIRGGRVTELHGRHSALAVFRGEQVLDRANLVKALKAASREIITRSCSTAPFRHSQLHSAFLKMRSRLSAASSDALGRVPQSNSVGRSALIGNWSRRQASKGQCRAVPHCRDDSMGTRYPHSICNFPLSLFTRIERAPFELSANCSRKITSSKLTSGLRNELNEPSFGS